MVDEQPCLAVATAVLSLSLTAASAQVSSPATPQVGSPTIGPPAPIERTTSDAPLPLLVPSNEPLPDNLTLEGALGAAEARSPAIVAARASVAAAQGRLRQAGFRDNPELSVEVENFLGTGELSGLQSTEVTVAVNQRLDLGGRRSARQAVGRAELAVSELRLLITRAELARSVRQQFATAVAARDRLRINELIAGVRGDIAVKVFGDDMDVLNRVAGEVAAAMRGVEGSADLKVEQTEGFPTLEVQFDREAIAR